VVSFQSPELLIPSSKLKISIGQKAMLVYEHKDGQLVMGTRASSRAYPNLVADFATGSQPR